MKRIHIFKTGTHTDSHGQTLTFSEADLTAAVAAYDPNLHQAPIVVGHPKTDNPAYGWVQSLNGDGGNLFATPEQVNTEFSEQVANGAYKKVSASFYPPNSPANPAKGAYYLRHVGFLGAEPPAIKGLQPIEFSESDDAVTLTVDFAEKQSAFDTFVSAMRTLFFGEDTTADTTTYDQNTNDQNIKPEADNQKDSSMSDPATTPVPPVTPTAPATPPVPNAPPTDTADKDAQIAALQAKLDAQAQAESAAKAAAAEKENADFSESLVNDGKIAPAEKSIITAMLDALDRDSSHAPVEFGEGDNKQPLKAAVKAKLTDANANTFSHLFSEAAGKPQTTNTAFGAPAGTAVDADRLALHEQALTYSEAHKVDYSTALMAISG